MTEGAAGRILVVDDDHAVRAVAARVVGPAGYEVEQVVRTAFSTEDRAAEAGQPRAPSLTPIT